MIENVFFYMNILGGDDVTTCQHLTLRTPGTRSLAAERYDGLVVDSARMLDSQDRPLTFAKVSACIPNMDPTLL
ncbi:hypothetical protein BDV95DRAFT_89592 [Massariosphaeria phaeospora]|uniref:Uncharacterized protein n=1 Tax=Massariosphaeria phaeospora TaxID=100035 RepID=A0A7C8I5L4_9PLEO|nr:hypothetical protein BDV95DRAFT_89592 [Massariosphaeria phaeospora]